LNRWRGCSESGAEEADCSEWQTGEDDKKEGDKGASDIS